MGLELPFSVLSKMVATGHMLRFKVSFSGRLAESPLPSGHTNISTLQRALWDMAGPCAVTKDAFGCASGEAGSDSRGSKEDEQT